MSPFIDATDIEEAQAILRRVRADLAEVHKIREGASATARSAIDRSLERSAGALIDADRRRREQLAEMNKYMRQAISPSQAVLESQRSQSNFHAGPWFSFLGRVGS